MTDPATITGSNRPGQGSLPPEEFYATLEAHSSGFYGCVPDEQPYGDGHVIVGWDASGDQPMYGETFRRKTGPVEYWIYKGGSGACIWRGFWFPFPSTVTVDSRGKFGGVSNGSASIMVALRRNGTIIASQTWTDTREPGLYFVLGSFHFEESISVDSGDHIEFTVWWSAGWDFQYYADVPGDVHFETHFELLDGVTNNPPRAFLRASADFAEPVG